MKDKKPCQYIGMDELYWKSGAMQDDLNTILKIDTDSPLFKMPLSVCN